MFLRFFSILYHFGCHLSYRFLFKLINPKKSKKKVAISFKNTLVTLGGFWIKFGQLLSLRTDLVSSETAFYLTDLIENSEAQNEKVTSDTLTKAYGEDFHSIFSDFSLKPFASASIAQVHYGKLRNENCEVAIKILKNRDIKYIIYDIKIFRILFWLLRKIGVLKGLNWKDFFDELKHALESEINLNYETRNILLATKFWSNSKIKIPKVFPKYTTKNTMVMEYIDGKSLAQLIKDETFKNSKKRKIKILTELYSAFLDNLFIDGFFHGDLHPGNIKIDTKGRTVLLDFGNCGLIDMEYIKLYFFHIYSTTKREYAKAIDYLLMMTQKDTIDLNKRAKIKSSLVRELKTWHSFLMTPNLNNDGIGSLTNGMEALARLLYDSKIVLDWNFLKISRTTGLIDRTILGLTNDFDYNRIISKASKKILFGYLEQSLNPVENYTRYLRNQLVLDLKLRSSEIKE